MKLKLLFVLLILCASCENSSNDETNSEDENSKEYINKDNANNEVADDETKNYKDGTYNASVDYYNPKTGYSTTYDLDVDVEDGQVVRINFPKGGWLDNDVHPSESQLSPAQLNEEGEAKMEDENGRTFEIKIDN